MVCSGLGLGFLLFMKQLRAFLGIPGSQPESLLSPTHLHDI